MTENRLIIESPDELFVGPVHNPQGGVWMSYSLDSDDTCYIRADLHEKKVAGLKAALQEILDKYIAPCNCSPEYTNRELEDPTCQYHRGYTIEIEAVSHNALEAARSVSGAATID